jgi:hypothetical protein
MPNTLNDERHLDEHTATDLHILVAARLRRGWQLHEHLRRHPPTYMLALANRNCNQLCRD